LSSAEVTTVQHGRAQLRAAVRIATSGSAMRAETQTLLAEIKQSLELLRRHL
jgi:hypothetical protein